jgi:LysM repeat protein
VEYLAATQRRRRIARFVAPLLLAAVVAAVMIVILDAHGSAGAHLRANSPAHADARHVRAFWTVRPGDTLAQIAARAGLTLNRLEALNPNVDPNGLLPGERLKLVRHPPPPPKARPKPLGPLFWIVQPGQSFGSIAAATGISLTTLQGLNPRLWTVALQPGNRIKLRRGAPLGELLWGSRGAALATMWREAARSGSTPRGREAHAKAPAATGLF